MLTRSQVARRLNKSIATVRRLEGWKLHPRRDADGIHRFDPAEVGRLSLEVSTPRTVHASPMIRATSDPVDWFYSDGRILRTDLERTPVTSDRERGSEAFAEDLVSETSQAEALECAVLAVELLDQLAALSDRQLCQLDLDAVIELIESIE